MFNINEGTPDMVPKYAIDAVRYEERGSFTDFLDEAGAVVHTLRTDTVFSIREGDPKPDQSTGNFWAF